MSRIVVFLVFVDEGFPRVSGDEPSDGTYTINANEFSPRERG